MIAGGAELTSNSRLSVFSNGSLVISAVAGGDAGKYSCTAASRRGLTSTQTATVRVLGESSARVAGFTTLVAVLW